jgi:hypothetical protein
VTRSSVISVLGGDGTLDAVSLERHGRTTVLATDGALSAIPAPRYTGLSAALTGGKDSPARIHRNRGPCGLPGLLKQEPVSHESCSGMPTP